MTRRKQVAEGRGARAAALAVGLALVAGGGIATVWGWFGLGFLAELTGFSLVLSRLSRQALTRHGGAVFGACLLSVLLMPLHPTGQGQAPEAGPPSPVSSPAVRPSSKNSLVEPAFGITGSGLGEDARRAIFQELRQAHARAKREAIRVHPDGDANTIGLNPEKEARRAQKRLKVIWALEAEYRKQIASRHELSEERLAAIDQEGIENNWPAPSDGTPAPTPIEAPRR